MENSIDHIITRILSGNSSSEDFLSLSEWLNADEKNKKEFRLLKSYWDAEVSFSHSLMPNVSLDNLRKKIDDQSRQKRLRPVSYTHLLDFSSVKDTFNLPLSSLLSSFQVIRLENSEDALTAAGQDTHIAVSDHYILVKSFRAGSSCKLYNRNGDFIRKISSQGQGPDEYNLSIYDQYLDENNNNKIYLMEIRCLLYTSRCV